MNQFFLEGTSKLLKTIQYLQRGPDASGFHSILDLGLGEGSS